MKKSILLFLSLFMLLVISGLSQNAAFDTAQQSIFKAVKTSTLSGNEWMAKPDQLFKNSESIAEDYGNAPQWDWAKKFDGSGQDVARKAVADEAGNYYVAGDFSGTMEFAGSTLTSHGNRDVFLAKLDESGNLLWIKQGNSGELSSCASYDIIKSGDHIFVTGYFDGDVFTIAGSSVGLTGLSDAFLLKVSVEGQIELLKNYGNNISLNRGLALTTDNNQNIYITGTTDGNTSYYHPSFLTKVDPEGNIIWWQEHSIGFCDLAVSGDQLYVAGTAYQDAWLGDIFLDPSVYNDAFVAKANLDGQYEWAVIGQHQQISWGDSFEPQIGIGAEGDVFMAGYFRNSVEFGSVLLTASSRDAFLVKINSSGNVLWATATTNTYNSLFGFTLLENDQPCISGAMGGSASFGNIVLETPDGGPGNYIAIYNSAGTAQSAFVADHQTSGLASFPGNKLLQTGTTDLDAYISEYDYSGNLYYKILSSGNSGTAQLTGLEVDDAGVVYSLSNLYGYTDFFAVPFDTQKNTLVLSAQKPDGDILWTALLEGGLSWWNFTETSLKLDEAHNRLFLHGLYDDTLKIGNLEFTTPARSAFTACYATNGEFLWAKNIPYEIDIQSVDADAAGNAYFIFGFFGTIEIEGLTFTSQSDGDALILKYNPDGDFISAKQIKTDVFFYSLGIATIPSGGYFVTVEPAGDTIYFNDGNNTMTFTPNDGRCIVAKYDDGGNYLWAKSFGYSPASYGGYYCWPTASVTDDSGNLYLTGTHGDSAMFDNIALRTPYNRYSPFTAKIDGNGNALWANSIQIHTWGNNYCEADIDSEGNFYCMGDLRDTIHLGEWDIIPTGPYDMYIARFDNSGEINWAKTIGSNSVGNHLYGIAAFDPDNLFIGGNFRNRISVGDQQLNTSTTRAGLMIHIGETILYTSIGEKNDTEIFVSAYPNPATDVVYLNFKMPFGKVKIELNDLNGRKVKTLTLQNPGETYTLDLTGFPGGTYLMTITADGKSCTRKIIIQ